MVTIKCKYNFFIWLKEKKNNSQSFLNVHDGQTVLVHGTNAELVSWLQQQKKNLTNQTNLGSCALVRQFNNTCNSQWHTQTHHSEAQEDVCFLKEPRHTKNCEENTHTHSHTINPLSPGRRVSAGPL